MIEGFAFASFIAWYETSFEHRPGKVSRLFARIGEYSYSIYLLHVFIVFKAANWIHRNVLDISSFYVALPVGLLVFGMMIPIGFISMKLIEAPFLRLRRKYYVNHQTLDVEASRPAGRVHP